MLHSLLDAYPTHGMHLYKTFDYWTCKDLLSIVAKSKISPEVKIQQYKNEVFRRMLDSISYTKQEWQCYDDSKYNLWQIKEVSHEEIH